MAPTTTPISPPPQYTLEWVCLHMLVCIYQLSFARKSVDLHGNCLQERKWRAWLYQWCWRNWASASAAKVCSSSLFLFYIKTFFFRGMTCIICQWYSNDKNLVSTYMKYNNTYFRGSSRCPGYFCLQLSGIKHVVLPNTIHGLSCVKYATWRHLLVYFCSTKYWRKKEYNKCKSEFFFYDECIFYFSWNMPLEAILEHFCEIIVSIENKSGSLFPVTVMLARVLCYSTASFLSFMVFQKVLESNQLLTLLSG